MWIYEKRLQCPVNIKETNAKLAQAIISQYGGPDGEMGASMRYLSQRYAMPYKECQATLTDIGTEELGHLEIVASIIYQLTKNLSMEEIKASVLTNIISITRLVSGHRQREVFRLMPVNSKARGIRLPTCTRIWRLNRRHAVPTTTSSDYVRIIRMFTSRSNSCVHVK